MLIHAKVRPSLNENEPPKQTKTPSKTVRMVTIIGRKCVCNFLHTVPAGKPDSYPV